jgi:SAM-dependent methyltransferase
MAIAEWLRELRDPLRRDWRQLPPELRGRLTRRHPRLRELERRYRDFGGAAVADPVWVPQFVATVDLVRFRGDGPYVWQKEAPNLGEDAVRRSFAFLRSSPAGALFDRLEEDGACGARTLDVDGVTVSRDLLDSVSELAFLDRRVGLAAPLRVLDVGAGYGRLAHRAVTAFRELSWRSTDAIALSTFLAETYLDWRGVASRAPVLPLDEFEVALAREPFDLAVNVHSFSECAVAAIDWWLSRLAAGGVPRLFLVPNAVSADGNEPLTNRGESMAPLLARHGFRLEHAEPKYADPVVQRTGLSPTTYFLYCSGRRR